MRIIFSNLWISNRIDRDLRNVGTGVGLKANVIDACVFKSGDGNNEIGITKKQRIILHIFLIETKNAQTLGTEIRNDICDAIGNQRRFFDDDLVRHTKLKATREHRHTVQVGLTNCHQTIRIDIQQQLQKPGSIILLVRQIESTYDSETSDAAFANEHAADREAQRYRATRWRAWSTCQPQRTACYIKKK